MRARRAAAVAALSLLLAGGLAGAVQPCAPEGGARGRPWMDGHLTWYDDRRLTNNGADDTDPAIATNSFGNSFVAYHRQGTHYLARVDRYGNLLEEERYVATARLPVQHSGQPCERAGIDRFSSFHLVWTGQQVLDPRYQKFSSDGKALTQNIGLGSLGSNPHALGMAAGPNERAYFAFENGSSDGIEMAYMESNLTAHTGFIAGRSGEGVTIAVDTHSRPHVFWRSGTGGELRMSVFNPEGDLEYDSVLVAEPPGASGLPMPAVAFTSDFCIHLLQADGLAGRRSLYYTRLSLNGTTLVPPVLVTNSSSDYGDICADSFQNVYIVWGNATDGQLSYTCIRPGSENTQLAARRLTGPAGTDTQPQIAASANGCIHVVWVSDRDGQKEIYYKFAQTDGAELSMAPEEMTKIMYVHINQTRTGNITVRNLGGQNDTVYLGINADFFGKPGGFGKNYTGGGYKVWFDEYYRQITIRPGEIIKVPVYVRGAPNGTPNEYIKVVVNGSSERNPWRNDTVEFRVYLIIDQRIELKCSDRFKGAWPGSPASYDLALANLGELHEQIGLSARGPLSWNFSLDRTGAWLGPHEETVIHLNVSPPPDAMPDETGIVTVTAQCAHTHPVSQSVTLTTYTTGRMSLELWPDRTEGTVEPGGWADYVLSVGNTGNYMRPTLFVIRAGFEERGWYVSLDAESITLAGGDSGFVVLRVAPPADAPSGSNLSVHIECFNEERTLLRECQITTYVGQARALAVSAAPEHGSLDPGGKAVFRVDVVNVGNGPDACRLGPPAMPAGWDFSLFGQNGQSAVNESIGLPHGGAAWFDVVVAAPASAPVGAVRIFGDVLDGAGGRYAYSFTVYVNQVFGVSLQAPAAERTGEPGQRVAFELDITNTGNGLDAFQLSGGNLSVGWRKVEFRDPGGIIGDRPELASGRTGRMQAIVEIPRSTRDASLSFAVTAASNGGPNATVALRLTVLKADLLVTKVDLMSSTPKAGVPVMVKVTVRNGGEAPARNATVAYYRNRALRTTEDLGTVLPGQERTATFVWVPLDGRNDLRFIADPLDSVCEQDEHNNEAVMERSLNKEILASLSPDSLWAVVAAVPLALAGLFLAVRAKRRRK